MDMSRYEFPAQKGLHQGLQYARSLGHQLLEVEHVALALLRADAVPQESGGAGLRRYLEAHLSRVPRIFGTRKVGFGGRLDAALDGAEAEAGDQQVDVDVLWSHLCRQSTVVKTYLAKVAEQPSVDGQVSREDVFRATKGQAVGSEGLGSSAPTSKGATKKGPPTAAESNPRVKRQTEATRLDDKLDKKLKQFTVDLSEVAERGELDPIIGRDGEVRRVLEILGRKKKNNPLLLGDPGVGKSAVAEGVAQRIAAGRVPVSMRNRRVLSLDLGALLAGAKYRGEFESRLKSVVEALQSLQGQVILFIDEIHMLVGAGNHEGGVDAANLLKPALARGLLQCIGATTFDEFRRYIEKDAALERRFQPLRVGEPSESEAIEILRGIKTRYEVHHGVKIADDAVVQAVKLSVRYLPTRRLPDKAIDLMDEAGSRLRMQIDSIPGILAELRDAISETEIELKGIASREPRQSLGLESSTGSESSAITGQIADQLGGKLREEKAAFHTYQGAWKRHQGLLEQLKHVQKSRQEAEGLLDNARSRGDFDFAARLQHAELPRLENEHEKIQQEIDCLQGDHGFLRQTVGAQEVAQVVAAWTGVPVGRLIESDNKKLLAVEDRLRAHVYGQDAAIEKVARAIKRSRVGINDPNRPIGVFLFLGPTGVGKTETAKALARELFADEAKIVRIDMSEFMESHNVARLIGAPPGYVGYGDGGELTEPVRARPYSVVLLDEMEKAHPKVLDLLLQIFEDGRLTDGKGRVVDFRNCLLVMTSNLETGLADPQEASDRSVRESLAATLRPEFINRIDEVVVFRRLGLVHLQLLLERLVRTLNVRLYDRRMRISLGPKLSQHLLSMGSHGPFGGRALRRVFETSVVDAVSDRILAQPDQAEGAWVLDHDEDGDIVWEEEYTPHLYLPSPYRA